MKRRKSNSVSGGVARRSGNEISEKQLRAMKRKAQARDRELVARGKVPPEAMLLLRPKRLRNVKLEWPDSSLIDD